MSVGINRYFVNVCLLLCTNHAAALLAAIHPGCSTVVECASALVQTLTAGPVVTAGTAEQIIFWVFTVTGSPPAVCLPILNSGNSGQGTNRLTAGQVRTCSKHTCCFISGCEGGNGTACVQQLL